MRNVPKWALQDTDPSVTIAATVYNEADRFLRRALECWQAVSDRIIVLDNGSSDATPDILAEFGAEIHDFGLEMDGNEVEARKFLWKKATEGSEWVVWADGELDVERGVGRYIDRPPFANYYDALRIQKDLAEPVPVDRSAPAKAVGGQR